MIFNKYDTYMFDYANFRTTDTLLAQIILGFGVRGILIIIILFRFI